MQMMMTMIGGQDNMNHDSNEVLSIIEKYTADLKGVEAVETANIISLICRWKDDKDIKKSMSNIEEIISHATDLFNYLLRLKAKMEEQDVEI